MAKLQKHLALLRQEYVKMQQKLADTERRCAMLAAQTSSQGSPSPAAANTFISRLLDIVADLYQQEQYRWGSWMGWIVVSHRRPRYSLLNAWVCSRILSADERVGFAVIWRWMWQGRSSVPISLCWLLAVMSGVWPTWPPPRNWTYLVSNPDLIWLF